MASQGCMFLRSGRPSAIPAGCIRQSPTHWLAHARSDCLMLIVAGASPTCTCSPPKGQGATRYAFNRASITQAGRPAGCMRPGIDMRASCGASRVVRLVWMSQRSPGRSHPQTGVRVGASRLLLLLASRLLPPVRPQPPCQLPTFSTASVASSAAAPAGTGIPGCNPLPNAAAADFLHGPVQGPLRRRRGARARRSQQRHTTAAAAGSEARRNGA